MRVVLALMYVGLLGSIPEASAATSRVDAFVNYSELGLSDKCVDLSPSCKGFAFNVACVLHPYETRSLCPLSCRVQRCNARSGQRVCDYMMWNTLPARYLGRTQRVPSSLRSLLSADAQYRMKGHATASGTFEYATRMMTAGLAAKSHYHMAYTSVSGGEPDPGDLST
jgi:hypothetical protein